MLPSGREPLPPWADDPLSTYFDQAEYNTRGSAINYARVYELLKDANDLFISFQDAVAQDDDQVLLIPRFFLIRTRAALLAATRLAMSGQIPEAYPLFRSAIEYGWYALHIAKDPAAPARARTWLSRGDSDQATRACKNEFTIARVRATHELHDRAEAEHVHQVYEGTIDLGGHPNQVALFASFTQTRAEEHQVGYTVGILTLSSTIHCPCNVRLRLGSLREH